MGDYKDFKAEQDRLFDLLQDRVDFAQAATREELAELKRKVDAVVKAIMVALPYSNEAEARAVVIPLMKAKLKLPADYTYPEPSDK